jgi:hypothetical protein
MTAYSTALADAHTREGNDLVREHTATRSHPARDRSLLIRIAAALEAYWLAGYDSATRVTHADLAGWVRVVPQWSAFYGDDRNEDVPANELTLWLDGDGQYVITADAPWLDTIEAVRL